MVLNGTLLHDESIRSYDNASSDERTGRNVAGQLVPHGFDLITYTFSSGIQPGIGYGNKGAAIRRGITISQGIKANHGQPQEIASFKVLPLHRKGDNVIIAIIGEVLVGHFGRLARTNQH